MTDFWKRVNIVKIGESVMSNPFTNIESICISVDNSSLVTDIEWNKNGRPSGKDPKGDLTLTFAKGERYEYVGVPSSILQSMLISESIGTFFHKNIKDRYTTYKEV